MSNSHQEKYITKLLIGVAFITAGIFVILYACFNRTAKDDWYFWGLVSSVAINTGVILVGSGFVHKMKSDLIKRQKQREQQKTFTAD
ncbi:MAG TPA: hypothetical protein VF487_04660 [Chitinophagaceae bacterium]